MIGRFSRQFASTCGTESIRGCRSSYDVSKLYATSSNANGLCASPIPGTSTSRLGCRQEHITLQALRDALKMRELIFRAFPWVQSAELRTYRELQTDELVLMMTGSVQRETEVSPRIISLVMQAKLFGFRFSMDGEALIGIPGEMHVSYS